MKKKGMPSLGEIVICTVKTINPNSVFAKLDEYENLEGMVHISEVKGGWVKDIRKHVKMGQMVIAKVVRINGNEISLSIKKVYSHQKAEKMKEYKFNLKADKMLEKVAKERKKTFEQAQKEIGSKAVENFGSLHNMFKMLIKNPKLVADVIPEEWYKPMKEIAEKAEENKEFEYRAKLNLSTLDPEGIKLIKNVLEGAEKMGLEVRYISAPNYLIRYKSKDPKKGEKEFNEKMKAISSNKKVEASFEILK